MKMKLTKVAEYRTLPDNSKGLEEKRNDLMAEMEGIIGGAKAETRTLTEVEETRFEEIKTEIEGIDSLLDKEETTRSLNNKEVVKKKDKNKEERSIEEINNEELRDIFSGKASESRAAMNSGTPSEGGHAINTELSKEIIKEIKDRSNVYAFFDGTTIKGHLRIPKQASSGTAEWVTENPTTDPTATVPTLAIIDLGQNRLYRESAITKQMINVEDIDLQGFIKGDIADSMADAIETAIFNGTGTNTPTGLVKGIAAKNKITVEARGIITVDDLKRAKAKIKKSVIGKAKWFMNSETFLEIDLLKDAMGRPMLQPNLADGTGYTLLGLPVELTDALKTPADTGANCLVVIATPQAYHTNTQQNVSLYIYDDSTYTRKGLVGYGSDVYLDGKTKDDQQVAGIFNKAA